jgi:hypothetical protein
MPPSAYRIFISVAAFICHAGIALAGETDTSRAACETNAQSGMCVAPSVKLPAAVEAHIDRPAPQSGTQAGGVAPASGPVQVNQSADIQRSRSYWPAFHNGSTMVFSEWQDGVVEIVYDVPRHGLSVNKGTLLFRGVKSGTRYSGLAYTFKAGCAPAAYAVSGSEDRRRELVVLTGAAPRRVGNSCDVNGETRGSANTKLVFDIHIDGDE